MKKVMMFALTCCIAMASIAYVATAAVDEAEFKALQQQVADLKASPLPANLSFHGYFRGRLAAAEADGSTWESTEFAFQPRWDASDKIHGEVHIWFWPSVGNTYMESGMMIFDEVGIGEGSKLILGKTRNFSYGLTPHGKNRKTTTYSLYNAAINQARVTGLQSLNKLDNGKIDLNIAILNGNTVGHRTVGLASYTGSAQANGSYALLANKDSGYDNNTNRAVSIRLAGKVIPSLQLGLNFYTGKLTAEHDALGVLIASEMKTIMDLTNETTNTTRTHDMFGIDFMYNDGTWMLQGEYTDGQLASLDFDGFQILGGFNFDAENSLYLEYGQLNYDLDGSVRNLLTDSTLAAPLTDIWDKSQFVISFKHKLAPRAWLQLEHEINMEDEPGNGLDYSAQTDNDMTFLEYMIVF